MTLATTIPISEQRLRAAPDPRRWRARPRLASGGPLAADARAATPAPVAVVASRPRDAGLRMPVLLITAFGAADTHAAAQRLGATLVLDRPLQVDTLCRLVRDVLSRG